jgi:hypothetical protein
MILDDFGMTAGDPSTIAAVSSCEMLSEMSGTRGQIWSNLAHQILAFWNILDLWLVSDRIDSSSKC